MLVAAEWTALVRPATEAGPTVRLMKRVVARLAPRLARKHDHIRRRLRRRFASPVRPERAQARMLSAPSVEVFVASLNTRAATELTLRSLLASDRSDFTILVGDGGSTDGSVLMLRELVDEFAGKIQLDLRPTGRQHHEWIEDRIAVSEADYVVFCDSDMWFRGQNPIRDLVSVAVETSAVMVAGEMCPAGPGVEPVHGTPVLMAPRPGAWLFLVEPARVRVLESSFAFHIREARGDTRFEWVAYDTGALWFEELRERGLPWASLPGSFTRRFRHYAGLTWRPVLGQEDDQRTARIKLDIERRLSLLRSGAA